MTSQTTQPFEIAPTPGRCATCDEDRCEEYVDRINELDVLLVTIQAQKYATTNGGDGEPLDTYRDQGTGWDRIACLARVLERQAVELRDLSRA